MVNGERLLEQNLRQQLLEKIVIIPTLQIGQSKLIGLKPMIETMLSGRLEDLQIRI